MANLKKPGFSRLCEECEIDYDDKIDRCNRCNTNVLNTDNWAPNPDFASKVVMHYLKLQPHISATEISKHYGVSEDSIMAGMRKLITDGVVTVTQTVSIVESKKK